MGIETVPDLISYKAYLDLPETMKRYEIIDGEMIMSPAPSVRHQIVLGNFYRAIFAFTSQLRLGTTLMAPVDIVVRKKPKLRTRQPDLVFVSNARKHIISERIEGGSDLVIEILSPGDRRKDIVKKLKDYAKIGVRECWMVSFEKETLEVLALKPGKIKRTGFYEPGDILDQSEVLPGIKLAIDDMFAWLG